jgi:transposase
MSTSPYSIDLRKRVINFIEAGNSQQSASDIFELNKSTVNRWWLRNKREGNCAARIRIGRKPRISAESLKNYIEKNPNFKTEELGVYFGMSGSGAFYWLKKLGYSYKKKPLPTWKQKKKSERSIRKK